MTIVRRSPWLNGRTALLLERLKAYEMTLPEDIARKLISDHLDTTAQRMRIGRDAAKYYVTDDVISKIARQLAGVDQSDDEDDDDDGTVVSLAAARHRKRQ